MSDEKKKKQIPAVAFWQIVDAIEEGKALNDKWVKWQREYIKREGLYLGDVNFTSGLISELKDGMAKPVGHMNQDDIDKAFEEMSAVTEANDKIEKLIKTVAKKYRLRPHQINIKTGEVTPTGCESIKEEKDVEDADRPVESE